MPHEGSSLGFTKRMDATPLRRHRSSGVVSERHGMIAGRSHNLSASCAGREVVMQGYVGLDVSQQVTHVCVVDAEGRVNWRGRCASTPDAIAATIKDKAPGVCRVGLESGPLSPWHYHGLKEIGLPVICVDARHAHAALGMRLNKTDKNDAHGLAELMRVGWYREVGVKGLDSHTVRAMLGVRYQLMGMRTNIINQMRGILKVCGIVLKPEFGRSQEEAIRRHCEENHGMLFETLAALLSVYQGLKHQITELDRLLARFVRSSSTCRLLMTIPGIGILTAAAYVCVIDDPKRFAKSHLVGAYLGLTPRRYQSGEVDRCGRISKCGDPLLRAYLFEAATSLLTRNMQWSTLKAWGLGVAKNRGMKKAKIAVARKLAVIMHRMWLSGEKFCFAAPVEATSGA
jgi:transposase